MILHSFETYFFFQMWFIKIVFDLNVVDFYLVKKKGKNVYFSLSFLKIWKCIVNFGIQAHFIVIIIKLASSNSNDGFMR